MKDFLIDVLILILKVMIWVLAIPTFLAVVASFLLGFVILFITGIVITPLGLISILKECLTEKKIDLTKDE